MSNFAGTATHWDLLVHTTLSDRDYILRSQQCQTVYSLHTLRWKKEILISNQLHKVETLYPWCLQDGWEGRNKTQIICVHKFIRCKSKR